jgi:hypothetical protein
MIPPRTYESYDSRYNHSWEVSESGDGLIHVHEPSLGGTHAVTSKQVDLKVDRDTIEKLLNLYFTEVAPIFPIVTHSRSHRLPRFSYTHVVWSPPRGDSSLKRSPIQSGMLRTPPLRWMMSHQRPPSSMSSHY